MKRTFIPLLIILFGVAGCTPVFGKKEVETLCLIPSNLSVKQLFKEPTSNYEFDIMLLSNESRHTPFFRKNHIDGHITYAGDGFSEHYTIKVQNLVVTGRVYKNWPDIFGRYIGGGRPYFSVEVSDGKKRLLMFPSNTHSNLISVLPTRCKISPEDN